jgi:DNA-binding LacI/PurR family transcriptional regulator
LRYLAQNKITSYKPAVIACDGIEQEEYTKPMLSTVSVNKREVASLAIETVLSRLKGTHSSPLVIQMEGKLLPRENCNPLKVF